MKWGTRPLGTAVLTLLGVCVLYQVSIGGALSRRTDALQAQLNKQRHLVHWLAAHQARINASLSPQAAPVPAPMLLGQVLALMQQQGIAKRAVKVRVLPQSQVEVACETVSFDRLLQAILQLKQHRIRVQNAQIFATQSVGYVNARVIFANQSVGLGGL